MSTRCFTKQVAEAVMVWSLNYWAEPLFCIEFEDIEYLKCLDLFLSTLAVFRDAFSSKIYDSCEEFLEQPSLSQKSFIDYLKPRALLLAEKNEYFDFMLICTYFSAIVGSRASSRNCFHLARVACKFLTRIFEDRFTEIFETDSGWENLTSYCRNIHAAVFPSIENRPPGYVPLPKSSKKDEVLAGSENDKKAEFIEEFENKVSEQEELERNEMFLAEPPGLIPEKVESSDSADSESLTDDATYWEYFNLDSSTICERITHNEEHLKDVYNLIKKLKQSMAAKCISSNKYDISASDEKYIEQLEKKDKKSIFFSEKKINFSDSIKKFYANKICEEENERLGATSLQDQVYPENVTDDQIREYFLKLIVRDDSKCELCDGKLDAFVQYWSESFQEKFSNSTLVTDTI